jgi:photosystem II stability/assembly factor-like uncharacterized protein
MRRTDAGIEAVPFACSDSSGKQTVRMPLAPRVLMPLLALIAAPAAAQQPRPVLVEQTSGTTALLQAVHALDAQHVWLSGHRATYAVTEDGGSTWRVARVPGDSTLQWRDLHAVSPTRAWLMAAGSGPASRIVTTDDGGATWTTAFVNADSAAFYDCLAVWPDGRGFAFSDAVAGRIPLVTTDDGRAWQVRTDLLPAARGTEGGFAASGTCATTLGDRHGWIATGNGTAPRVHRTADGGRAWDAVEVPLLRGGASGAAAIAFRDSLVGVVLGGAIDNKATGPRTAVTRDGGRSWQTTGEPAFAGAIYGAAYAKVGSAWRLLAVGPGGAAWSADDGTTWQPLAEGSFWSVGAAPDGTAWLVGPRGRIVRVTWE